LSLLYGPMSEVANTAPYDELAAYTASVSRASDRKDSALQQGRDCCAAGFSISPMPGQGQQRRRSPRLRFDSCPLHLESGLKSTRWLRVAKCQFRLMHCSKQPLYSITASASASSVGVRLAHSGSIHQDDARTSQSGRPPER